MEMLLVCANLFYGRAALEDFSRIYSKDTRKLCTLLRLRLAFARGCRDLSAQPRETPAAWAPVLAPGDAQPSGNRGRKALTLRTCAFIFSNTN